MPEGNYTCALCGAGGMTEREAEAHDCDAPPPPEPDLADLPMTTREAVTVLANQLANINDRLFIMNEILTKYGALLERSLPPNILILTKEPPSDEQQQGQEPSDPPA